MSLINVSVNLVAYADDARSTNPKVKFTDLSWSMLGLPTDIPHAVPINLQPGESQTLILLNRALSFTTGTTFSIVDVPTTLDAQLVGTFGQRVARTYGDNTTEWTVSLSNTLATMQYTGTGTAPDFTTMQAGDGITLGAGFNPLNQGDFTVVAVSVSGTSIQFVNAIAQSETVTALAQIYSSGPVQLGDTLDLTSTAFAFPNRGKFKVKRVTDTYIQFANQNAVPQSGVTGVASTDLVVYSEFHSWMLMAVDRKIIVKLNGDTGSGVEVEPPVEGDLVNSPGLYLKRGKVFSVVISNPGLAVATGTVFLAQ